MDSITAVMGTDLSLLDCPLYTTPLLSVNPSQDPMHLKTSGAKGQMKGQK